MLNCAKSSIENLRNYKNVRNMFKVNNNDVVLVSALVTLKHFTPSSSVSIADFEQYMLAGQQEFYSI